MKLFIVKEAGFTWLGHINTEAPGWSGTVEFIRVGRLVIAFQMYLKPRIAL